MTSNNKHIIHRVNLEINVQDLRLANQLKDGARRLFDNEILPALEKCMDTIELNNEHVQFNRLDIHLENLSEENFEKQFSALLVQAFRKRIENDVSPSPQGNKPEQENAPVKYNGDQFTLRSFLYFLETGRLPWWNEKSGEILKEKNLTEILDKSTQEFQEQLWNLLSSNKIAFERLLNQFSVGFIFNSVMVQKRYPNDQLKREFLEMLHYFAKKDSTSDPDLSNQFQIVIKEIVRQIYHSEELSSIKDLQNIFLKFKSVLIVHDKTGLEELLAKMNLAIKSDVTVKQPVSTLTETKKEQENNPEETGIFLKNAGLVLLHPFLESLFNGFDWLTKGQFRDINSQTMAVHLMHYLATKEELAAEYDQVMEKFLCGWDPDMPIAKEIPLSQGMKSESETLLGAAIRHWSALKSTSPDGLREGFLQRDGKLILNEFQNRLIVENKAQDVLLSYLPWGFSVFKLPWMKSPLYVEWQ
jgi:hypothetical protein